jgi:hypothetical protein
MSTTTSSGYYRVTETRTGHHIVLVGGNGEPIASGEKLTRKGSAIEACLAITRMYLPPWAIVNYSRDDKCVVVTFNSDIHMIPVRFVDKRRGRWGRGRADA